jgi:hypothetical protein
MQLRLIEIRWGGRLWKIRGEAICSGFVGCVSTPLFRQCKLGLLIDLIN